MHFPEGVKVPTEFSANVKKLVSMKDLSITHCKAHDCHVMLTVFLSIAIRAIKPEFLKMVKALVWFWLIDEILSANLVYQSDYDDGDGMVMIKCLNSKKIKRKTKDSRQRYKK